MNTFQDYGQFDPALDFATPLSKWGNVNRVEDLKPYLDSIVAEAVADPQSYRKVIGRLRFKIFFKMRM